MPLFYSHTINEHTKLAVWHITEPETFFYDHGFPVQQISHPQKRLQHLAGRYLLRHLYPDFPLHLIAISSSKKPVLPGNSCHFSISHCGDYAGAIISKSKPVGIDVELVTPKILNIAPKFLNDKERDLLEKTSNKDNPEIITLFWSAKEAIFKWYGKGGVSFKNNMLLLNMITESTNEHLQALFIKEVHIELQIQFKLFDNICLAWVENYLYSPACSQSQ